VLPDGSETPDRANAALRRNEEATMVDNDRVEGTAKKVGGSIKETVGKVTGNERTEAEGAAQKTEGEAQTTVGKVKDKVRDVTGL
jgi:uncharacterized protein YjbJ (UPF0337 family)